MIVRQAIYEQSMFSMSHKAEEEPSSVVLEQNEDNDSFIE